MDDTQTVVEIKPLQVSKQLAQEISDEAKNRGLPIEDFLRVMLRRERTLTNRRKIEQEQAWWLSLPMSKRAEYEGKFVAVHNQTLVDYDQNDQALYRRVRSKYGQTAVLIMPAEGPRDIHIVSPQVEQRTK